MEKQVEIIEVTDETIRAAIKTVAAYGLVRRLQEMDGQEAHRVLPQIWPIIREVSILALACEAGKLQASP